MRLSLNVNLNSWNVSQKLTPEFCENPICWIAIYKFCKLFPYSPVLWRTPVVDVYVAETTAIYIFIYELSGTESVSIKMLHSPSKARVRWKWSHLHPHIQFDITLDGKFNVVKKGWRGWKSLFSEGGLGGLKLSLDEEKVSALYECLACNPWHRIKMFMSSCVSAKTIWID